MTGLTGLLTMTIKMFFTTSIIIHLGSLTGHTYAFMRLNVRDAATSHSVVAITNYYVKFESCPPTGPLNTSCNTRYTAVRARFGPTDFRDLIGHYLAVNPPDACEGLSPSPTQGTSSKAVPYIAIINKDNCSFEIKVSNAEKAGYRAVIIYGSKEDKDKDLLNMSSSNPTLRVTIPSFYVNHDTGIMLALSSRLVNTSRPSMLHIATKKTILSSPPNFTGKLGAINANSGEEEDGDNFGEHYFHICIYIWACVVVSSLIGLSVKWGCCGRSLTRWEVTKIPLKRFRRNSGSDYQDKCPICHEEFHEGRLIRQLPCNHCYHSYCVDRWLVKMSNRCPLCKQRVSVSLFCSWSKQRDGQGGVQHSDADLDAEEASVVGELPPLPPVQTLTPNTLYGDVIMSGPSKFILMRPGKATRVIQVPKKENNSQNKQYAQSAVEDQQQQQTCAIVSTPPLPTPHGKQDKLSYPSDKHSVTLVSSLSSLCHSDSKKSKKKTEDYHDENFSYHEKFPVAEDHSDSICMETLNHRSHSPLHHHHHHHHNHHHHLHQNTTPRKSSRSSSITSEHPLLTEEEQGSAKVSLHSITDRLIGEVGGPQQQQTCAMQCVTAKAGSTRMKGEDRNTFAQDIDSSSLLHYRSVHTSSDSSDYGCHCDFIDDEESQRRRSKQCDDDDDNDDNKNVVDSENPEVNVNAYPQLFPSHLEQNYSGIYPPQQAQQQQHLLQQKLAFKRKNCEISLSKGGNSGGDVCVLKLPLEGDSISILDRTPITAATTTTSTTRVNNNNVHADGNCCRFSRSNNVAGGGVCACHRGDVAGSGRDVHDHRSIDYKCKHFQGDTSRLFGSRDEESDVKSGDKTTVCDDGRTGHSLFKQLDLLKTSDVTTAPKIVPATRKTRAPTTTIPASTDAGRMSKSYPPSSARQIVATWDSSLRRGLGMTKRNKSYCPSTSTKSGKNVQTL